jgi:hypothetical protein
MMEIKRKKGRTADPFSSIFSPCRTGRLCGTDAIAVSQARQQDFAQIVTQTIIASIPQNYWRVWLRGSEKNRAPDEGAAS